MIFLNIMFILILGVLLLISFYVIQLGYEYYENRRQSSKKSRYFVEQSDDSISRHSDGIPVDNEDNILKTIPAYKDVFEGSNSTANPVEMIRPQSFEASDHAVIQWLNSLRITHQKNQEYLRKESVMPIFSMLKK